MWRYVKHLGTWAIMQLLCVSRTTRVTLISSLPIAQLNYLDSCFSLWNSCTSAGWGSIGWIRYRWHFTVTLQLLLLGQSDGEQGRNGGTWISTTSSEQRTHDLLNSMFTDSPGDVDVFSAGGGDFENNCIWDNSRKSTLKLLTSWWRFTAQGDSVSVSRLIRIQS